MRVRPAAGVSSGRACPTLYAVRVAESRISVVPGGGAIADGAAGVGRGVRPRAILVLQLLRSRTLVVVELPCPSASLAPPLDDRIANGLAANPEHSCNEPACGEVADCHYALGVAVEIFRESSASRPSGNSTRASFAWRRSSSRTWCCGCPLCVAATRLVTSSSAAV